MLLPARLEVQGTELGSTVTLSFIEPENQVKFCGAPLPALHPSVPLSSAHSWSVQSSHTLTPLVFSGCSGQQDVASGLHLRCKVRDQSWDTHTHTPSSQGNTTNWPFAGPLPLCAALPSGTSAAASSTVSHQRRMCSSASPASGTASGAWLDWAGHPRGPGGWAGQGHIHRTSEGTMSKVWPPPNSGSVA